MQKLRRKLQHVFPCIVPTKKNPKNQTNHQTCNQNSFHYKEVCTLRSFRLEKLPGKAEGSTSTCKVTRSQGIDFQQVLGYRSKTWQAWISKLPGPPASDEGAFCHLQHHAELNIFLPNNHQLKTPDGQITKLFLPNSETIPKLLRYMTSLKVWLGHCLWKTNQLLFPWHLYHNGPYRINSVFNQRIATLLPSSFTTALSLQLKLAPLLAGALEFYFLPKGTQLRRKDTGRSETLGLCLHLRTQIKKFTWGQPPLSPRSSAFCLIFWLWEVIAYRHWNRGLRDHRTAPELP